MHPIFLNLIFGLVIGFILRKTTCYVTIIFVLVFTDLIKGNIFVQHGFAFKIIVQCVSFTHFSDAKRLVLFRASLLQGARFFSR